MQRFEPQADISWAPALTHCTYWAAALWRALCTVLMKAEHGENVLCYVLCLVAQLCLTLSLCDPMECSPPGSSVHGDSSGKNLPHCRQILYQLSPQGSPRTLEWVAYPFSRGSSQPRNWTGVSCIAGRFFTSWATREAQKCPSFPEISSLVMGWVWEERVAIHARDLCILLIFIATQILVDLAFCMSKFTPFLLSLFLSLFSFSFGEISKTPIADIFSDKCPSVDSRSPKVCLYLGLLKDSNSSGCAPEKPSCWLARAGSEWWEGSGGIT